MQEQIEAVIVGHIRSSNYHIISDPLSLLKHRSFLVIGSPTIIIYFRDTKLSIKCPSEAQYPSESELFYIDIEYADVELFSKLDNVLKNKCKQPKQ